ncbi:MAG: hypothetical protein U0704_16090 [Candidatus Eisenbacteria bacterium]
MTIAAWIGEACQLHSTDIIPPAHGRRGCGLGGGGATYHGIHGTLRERFEHRAAAFRAARKMRPEAGPAQRGIFRGGIAGELPPDRHERRLGFRDAAREQQQFGAHEPRLPAHLRVVVGRDQVPELLDLLLALHARELGLALLERVAHQPLRRLERERVRGLRRRQREVLGAGVDPVAAPLEQPRAFEVRRGAEHAGVRPAAQHVVVGGDRGVRLPERFHACAAVNSARPTSRRPLPVAAAQRA